MTSYVGCRISQYWIPSRYDCKDMNINVIVIRSSKKFSTWDLTNSKFEMSKTKLYGIIHVIRKSMFEIVNSNTIFHSINMISVFDICGMDHWTCLRHNYKKSKLPTRVVIFVFLYLFVMIYSFSFIFVHEKGFFACKKTVIVY